MRAKEEVNQQHEPQAQFAEDIERLVNEQLQSLQPKWSANEALCQEVDRLNFSPFTDEVEQTIRPKWFTTPTIMPFREDSI